MRAFIPEIFLATLGLAALALVVNWEKAPRLQVQRQVDSELICYRSEPDWRPTKVRIPTGEYVQPIPDTPSCNPFEPRQPATCVGMMDGWMREEEERRASPGTRSN